MTKDDAENPLKQNCCQKVCQSRLCLPLVAVAMMAGVAVTVPVVLLSQSIRDRFAPEQPWWQKTIVYQVYPRSFQDSDGDGIGDLKGITSRLDHLNYLNIKAMWISPFYPSPMADFGYDVSNYTDVDYRFGTLEDFDDLLDKAHKKDIKVIIDFVAGHTSWEHDWFEKSVNRVSPYEDYYIWANGTILQDGSRAEPSNWKSNFGHSAWTWNDTRGQYYYHAYLKEQPTLNYRNPLVVEEMKNVLRFWLERGVDGIRVDAAGNMMVSEDYYQDQAPSNQPGTEKWERAYYINNLTSNMPELEDIIRGWREVLDAYDDSDDENDNYKYMLVELTASPEERAKYYDYGADMPFNFDLVKALDPKSSIRWDVTCLSTVIQAEYETVPDGDWANFVLSSHDVHRIASRMGAEYVDALNMLLLTLRGTPTTYYGDEIGMVDVDVSFSDTQDPKGINYGQARYQEVSRDPERSPMQWDGTMNAGFSNSSDTWLPVHPDYRTLNVQVEENSTSVTSIKVYRDLAILRDEPSFRYGFFMWGHVTSSVLSYLRTSRGHPQYLVAFNLGNATVTQDFSGSPVNQGQGKIKVVTSAAANGGRFIKDASVSLKSISLNPGDGVVFELPESDA